eukprot:288459-Chlamydomonas_euryale.AAC.1
MRTSIEAGCNPSLADYSGRTPLMAASQSGRDEAVEFLLSRNAHHGARDSLGRNALLYAVRANHANVINLLVGAGARCAAAEGKIRVPGSGGCERQRAAVRGARKARKRDQRAGAGRRQVRGGGIHSLS